MTSTFDERAQTWDEAPRRVQLAADIFAALARRIPLCPDWSALDYGCGTGLLTLALAPRVRRVVAVDSSKGMLGVLAQKAQIAGFADVEPLLADFSKDPPPPGPFDLIASAMTLHHVADVEALFRKFFALLASGACSPLIPPRACSGFSRKKYKPPGPPTSSRSWPISRKTRRRPAPSTSSLPR